MSQNVNEMFAVVDFTQRRLVVSDVSGENIGLIFKSLIAWRLEDGIDRLPRNSGN